VQQHNLPAGQFPTFVTSAQPLRVEDDAKTRLYTNVLCPVEALLPQGIFAATPGGFLGASDYVLCINNYTVAKMPVEMKTLSYNFWQIYRYASRRKITDPIFKFKKRILSQICEMACNGLHYGILSIYSDAYFLKQEETTLYVSRVVQPTDTNTILRECVYYISQLAINDNVGNRLGHVVFDSILSNDDDDSSYCDSDDPDDPNYYSDDSEFSDVWRI
jgi:hypothetical protein